MTKPANPFFVDLPNGERVNIRPLQPEELTRINRLSVPANGGLMIGLALLNDDWTPAFTIGNETDEQFGMRVIHQSGMDQPTATAIVKGLLNMADTFIRAHSTRRKPKGPRR